MDDIEELLEESVDVIHRTNKGKGYQCRHCGCWFLTATSYFKHAHPTTGGCRD